MTRGLLLFAHGARDPRWAEPFDAVAERIRGVAPKLRVELAFLEFMTPSLREAAGRLVTDGCSVVDVVPLFLGAGGHVRKDLPELMSELRACHAGVQWRIRPAIGEVDAVIDAMAKAALDLCARPPEDAP
jgi:sirohydrochlorin cobaltochelatase